MLIYFNKNKARYEKGQMTPFFILILVVLIIIAMVTVNLSKVAFIKTDSSNAVDAGALAAGSVMANVFNAVAQANSQMETSYWEFYATVSASFSLALGFLIAAHLKAIAAEAAAAAALAAAGTALGFGIGAVATVFIPPVSLPLSDAAGAFITAAIASLTAASLAIKAAIMWMKFFISTMWAILIATTAFSAAQVYYYWIIRDMAEEGRDSGITIGHQFAFMNSGIGAKLREGSPPDNADDIVGDSHNYRDSFSDFLKDEVEYDDSYTYRWQDGQDRNHYVTTEVDIDPVDTFDLQVAVLPLAAEILLLNQLIVLGNSALAALEAADVAYESAGLSYIIAQVAYFAATALLAAAAVCYACRNAPFIGPACTACYLALSTAANIALAVGAAAGTVMNAIGIAFNAIGLGANGSAIAIMESMYAPLAIAWAGLLPGWIFRSTSKTDAAPFIICWIDDIVHNRLVRLDTEQHHAGADLGLWHTRYPDMQSYSIADFTGKGQIRPTPVLRHDCSLVETDNISGAAHDICPQILSDIAALERAVYGYDVYEPGHEGDPDYLHHIPGLYDSAASMEQSAADLEAEALILQQLGQVEQANALLANAATLRAGAASLRQQASEKEQQIQEIRDANAQCFS